MIKTLRTFFLSFSILAFLLFSTIGTTTVYADDGSGTDPSAAETTTPTEETQPEEPAADETPPPTEETPPAVETPAPTEATPPAETPVTEEAAPAETIEVILAQVPDNTTVTVLNTEGEALPLVSQQAAETIAAGYDPIWCPAGQVPTPGENGCTPSFSSFDELLAFLQANESAAAYQQAGTIYIQQGNYMGGETTIDFNAYSFTQFNNYDLTLQGGWDTNYQPSDGAPVFTTTNFNVPIIIGSSSNPWGGSLTLNNIFISGVSDQTALTLYSNGDVNLNDVEVTNSQSGASLHAGQNVNVQRSKFNNNGSGNVEDPVGKGLEVVSGGSVTLASVEANYNQIYGADIQAVGNVTVTNGFFNSNQGYYYLNGWVYEGYGLKIVTSGNVSLSSVTADDNYLFGASLEGALVNVSDSSFSNNQSDWHEHSTGSGLKVVSTSDVTLAGVTANNNQIFGADINTAGEVNVTNSFFNGNKSYTYSQDGEKSYYGYGLHIFTTDDISLINVEATDNNLYGALLEANDVAVDTANFSNNGSGDALALTGYGLKVVSENDVALIRVTANNNQKFGADIQATGAVAIQASFFNGQIAYYHDYFTGEILQRDGGYGLHVVTLGPIALKDVEAQGNYLYGAHLEGGNTTVENSVFTNNGSGVITSPTAYGLKINSTDKVTLIGVNASNNQLFGADIQAAKAVVITNSFFSGHQTVTFSPDTGLTFYGYGLTVNTQDNITLNGVAANFNNLWGASLTGNNVTVYNSQFNNNVSDSNIFIDDTGLIINASGYVDIFRVEAKENRLIGATINAQGDVFITDSTFTDNRGYTCVYSWCPEGSLVYHGFGLQVTTPGTIELSGVNASNNNLFGAELNGSTILVENSIFANNQFGNGLTVNATDNVTLTNVTATNNGGSGVEVNGVCQKIVQVNGGTYTDNALYGIKVINATLNLDGGQTFANNGSGNVFNDTSTCVIVPTTTTTIVATTTGSQGTTLTPSNPSQSTQIVEKKSKNTNVDKKSKHKKTALKKVNKKAVVKFRRAAK
ncbi:MAG: right-handed parallel beta-helix repeat-containing protein [Chloroflexi bacterium]|nr:right-handed parallel beta-helix repeat-containing protein [Chloroflexota bacterium]MBI5703699.1 right-handed parallel beta-helix repeat-containing protein [Chloroflexota bacterium]